MELIKFENLIDRYQVIFFDSFGVLKNYAGIIDGTKELLQKLEEKKKKFLLLTNDASRSSGALCKSFNDAGISQINKDMIISSGMLTMDFLKSKVDLGCIVYLGTEASARHIRNFGYKVISIMDIFTEDKNQVPIKDVKGLLFLDDEGFDWRTALNNCVNLLRMKNIPTIVANSDFIYPKTKNTNAIAIGGLASLVERIVNKYFIYFGKPDVQIFYKAFQLVNEDIKVDKRDVLMVGDTLTTDILGGNQFGIDTALVLSGNTWPESYKSAIESKGIIPNYICNSIAD